MAAQPMEASPRGVEPTLVKEVEAMLSEIDVKLDRESVRLSGGSGWSLMRSQDDDLNKYSILLPVQAERKLKFVEDATARDPLMDRVMGSMSGMAVGDALGHPFEFDPVQDYKDKYTPKVDEFFELATMQFHNESNVFRLERGQWTDDAAMGLCMADSLIMCQDLHGSDMRIRFWCWWNRGYNNAFRKDKTRTSSVGLGGNISKSLSAIGRLSNEEVPPAFNGGTEDAGNGSLMRFTPIAVFLHACDDMTLVHKWAQASSYTTHPGIIAALACSLLGHLIVRALQLPFGETVDVQAWMERTTQEFLESPTVAGKTGWGYDQIKELAAGKPSAATEACWEWRNKSLNIAGTLKARGREYNGYPVSAGYFGAYSLDGLAMAMWSVYHTKSFDEAVTRSVNLLGDADSHGSITGQLAGALYGYRSINPQFRTWLSRWDDGDFAVKGAMLAHLGTKYVARMRADGTQGAAAPPAKSTDDEAGL